MKARTILLLAVLSAVAGWWLPGPLSEWTALAGSRFQRAADLFLVLVVLAAVIGGRRGLAARWSGIREAFDPAQPCCGPVAGVLLLAAVFLTILGAKMCLIARFGSDLPFWDQWDAEGAFLIQPFVEGRLRLAQLFAPHNEHRIFFTRIASLGWFLLNDRQWDCRLELIGNAALHGFAALLLAWLAIRALPGRLAAAYAAAVALFAGTAVSSYNILGGFQSQFYFLFLFAGLHLGATLMASPRSPVWWIAPLFGAAGLFAMASGLVSAAAILAVVALGFARERRLRDGDAWVIAANLGLVIGGLFLRVHVPGHDYLRSPGAWAPIESWLWQLAWPVGTPWAAALGLLPTLALAASFLRSRTDGPIARTLLAAGAWVWLQEWAIAVMRGRSNHGLESRYMDILAIGVLVNLLTIAVLASGAVSQRGRKLGVAATLGLAAVAALGLASWNREVYMNDLRICPAIAAARVGAVRSYLAFRDPAFLGRTPWSELPYPNAQRLAQILDEPSIRAALPSSVRPPVRLDSDRPPLEGAAAAEVAAAPPPMGLPVRIVDGSAGPSRFSSGWFSADHSRITIFVAGSGGAGGARLRILDPSGRAWEPLGDGAPAGPRWKRVNFAVHAGRARLEAEVGAGGRLAFTTPFTDTGLSRFGQTFAGSGAWLIAAGLVIGLGTVLGMRPSRRMP